MCAFVDLPGPPFSPGQMSVGPLASTRILPFTIMTCTIMTRLNPQAVSTSSNNSRHRRTWPACDDHGRAGNLGPGRRVASTWKCAGLGPCWSCSFAAALLAAACGSRPGRPVPARSGGAAQQPGLPQEAPLQEAVDLSFPSPQKGWLAITGPEPGAQGTMGTAVLGTTDRGAHWRPEWSGPGSPEQLTAVGTRHAFLVLHPVSSCPSGTPSQCGVDQLATNLLATADAGRSWKLVWSSSAQLSNFSFASPMLGLGVIERRPCPQDFPASGRVPHCPGGVVRTTDGGYRWSTVLRTPGPVLAVADRGAKTWWAVQSVMASGAKPAGFFGPARRVGKPRQRRGLGGTGENRRAGTILPEPEGSGPTISWASGRTVAERGRPWQLRYARVCHRRGMAQLHRRPDVDLCSRRRSSVRWLRPEPQPATGCIAGRHHLRRNGGQPGRLPSARRHPGSLGRSTVAGGTYVALRGRHFY